MQRHCLNEATNKSTANFVSAQLHRTGRVVANLEVVRSSQG